ncbi:Gluconolactonase [Andreprevotia sp. IGB-42]|uniref:SMP-30/gluconolactonase/LRE family protein n=1 Tax=Andreprevotia sp. IGB-42 TaxID=2497473 RepID=UPI00157F1945|nr:SMP-30/gluconolactonase/LRE family protein [Andreprevotia sp. IGB-42]KAF0813758.1 Gluconolactonase [Andreprevotia sp. IGB-42]
MKTIALSHWQRSALLAFVALTHVAFAQQAKPVLSRVLTPAVFTTGIEGPAVDDAGNLYVVNFDHDGSIGQLTPGASAPTLLVDLPAGSISSGMRFDGRGNLYATDHVGHNVYKINLATRAVSIHASNPAMNQPNDLALMKNGVLFASDPHWGSRSGKLWRIDTDGSSTLLAENMGTTNGIEVSPDNKTLYVNESMQRTIWRFAIDAAGNISGKTRFKDFADGGLDGMRVHPDGNLYVTRYGKGSVVVLSPAGAVVREIALHGNKPTNIAFSPDYRQAYVTLQDKRWVEVFDVNTR